MGTAGTCISVIDDDALVLRSLDRLLQSVGFAVQTFSRRASFSSSAASARPAHPGRSFHARPRRPGAAAHAGPRGRSAARDLPQRARRYPEQRRSHEGRRGRLLTKPCEEAKLIAAVRRRWRKTAPPAKRTPSAIDRRARRHPAAARRELLSRVVAGGLNKQIAAELGTAEKTVKCTVRA